MSVGLNNRITENTGIKLFIDIWYKQLSDIYAVQEVNMDTDIMALHVSASYIATWN